MASQPTQSTRARELYVDMTLSGHERAYYHSPDGRVFENELGPAICYFPDGQQMISGSGDKTTRLWDMRAGKERKEARVVNEHGVHAVAVSRDGRWLITACGGLTDPGEVKACEWKTGIVKIFEGHPQGISCIGISVNSKLLARGSWDGTTRIWSLDTGELVGGSLDPRSNIVSAVRFSHNSKKFAVNLSTGKCLEVWDIETRKLDVSVGKYSSSAPWRGGLVICPPLFWTTQDRTIVAAFSFWNGDSNSDSYPTTIYEFDSLTLETIRVGAPFKGHTCIILGLALSSDCTFPVSVSDDDTVKLWAFDSRQLLASFHVQSLESCPLP